MMGMPPKMSPQDEAMQAAKLRAEAKRRAKKKMQAQQMTQGSVPPEPAMKQMPMAQPSSFKKGGKVKKTGMALVHKGEKVLTKKQQESKKPMSKASVKAVAKKSDSKRKC
jgi:hypothetical protein